MILSNRLPIRNSSARGLDWEDSNKPTCNWFGTKMAHRTSTIVTAFIVVTVLSLIREYYYSIRVTNIYFRGSSRELDFRNEHSGDIPVYVRSSQHHYLQDEKLAVHYSTTHHKVRGNFALLLDNENNHVTNDYQHKGILRVGTEKLGKWTKIRRLPKDSVFVVEGEIIRKAGTNYSKYVDDMRLVIDANHTILPKIDDNNEHICRTLRAMTNRNDLTVMPEEGIPPIVLNVTADCIALSESISSGQGSTILALYGLRLISATANIDFEFQCYSNNFDTTIANIALKERVRKLRWVFPWFASYQAATTSKQSWPYGGRIQPTQKEICNSNLDNMPIHTMANLIRDDIRRMAVRLIGPKKESNRTHPLVPLDATPWIPGINVDDAIIHFPCYNDVNENTAMNRILRDNEHGNKESTGSDRNLHNNNSVGMLNFSEYTKRIARQVKSIGIISEASINNGQSSNENNDWCQHGSQLLLHYLKNYYASKKVSISVYDNDRLPLQYARMAMAKQTFSSFSTFGMIPIIGTFGEGYFYPSNGTSSKNQKVIKNIISSNYEGFDNVHLIEDALILSPKQISSMDVDSI